MPTSKSKLGKAESEANLANKAKRMRARSLKYYQLGAAAIAGDAKGLEKFVDESGLSSRYARQMRLVAKRIDRKLMKWIVGQTRVKSQLPLNWGHVFYLATVDVDGKRAREKQIRDFTKQAIVGNWDARTLYVAIRDSRRDATRNWMTHGRSPKEGNDLQALLKRRVEEGVQWAERLRGVAKQFGADSKPRKMRQVKASLKRSIDEIRKSISAAYRYVGS